MIDSALILKKMIDSGEQITLDAVSHHLNNSSILQDIISVEATKPLAMIWKLIALSEIPYAETVSYTQNLIKRVYKSMSTDMGFSLNGTEQHFLPCYNSMLISALCRLGRHEDQEVKNGIKWIVDHQPFTRGAIIDTINGASFNRYGGCFKSTPCYIGVVKATNALFSYTLKCANEEVSGKAHEGLEYILSHQLFKRKTSNKPITKHIMDISFPESYHTNIVDLLRLMALAQVKNDSRIDDAISYVKSKAVGQNQWRISFRYRAEGYSVFDKGRQPAEWVSHIIVDALDKLGCQN